MRIVVVGTGTEIGKTHLCASLLAFARSRSVRAAAYKPIATGVSAACEDCLAHAAALGAAYVPPTYAYRRPVSPHLAAREEGRAIDLARVGQEADAMDVGVELLVVETAGGLFTPLSDTLTNADLVKRLLPAAVVLVAPDRIGVLHEVRACLLAARASSVPVAAVVLSAPAVPDPSTGSNPAELDALGLGPVAAMLPRAAFDAKQSLQAAAQLWAALGGEPSPPGPASPGATEPPSGRPSR